MADTHLFHIVYGRGNGLFHGKAVKETAVAHYAFLCIQALLAYIGPFNERDDGQAEFPGKSIVPAVVGGNGHDGAGAIASKHIFRNPYRHFLSGERVDSVRAGEYAGNCLTCNSFTFRLLLHLLQIGLNFGLL